MSCRLFGGRGGDKLLVGCHTIFLGGVSMVEVGEEGGRDEGCTFCGKWDCFRIDIVVSLRSYCG